MTVGIAAAQRLSSAFLLLKRRLTPVPDTRARLAKFQTEFGSAYPLSAAANAEQAIAQS